jgi:hypothetical protein
MPIDFVRVLSDNLAKSSIYKRQYRNFRTDGADVGGRDAVGGTYYIVKLRVTFKFMAQIKQKQVIFCLL